MTIKLFVGAIAKFLLGIALVGALIFLPAGTLAYSNGWLLMAVLFAPILAVGIALAVKDPKLLKRRLESKEKEAEQFFDEEASRIAEIDTDSVTGTPSTAFFSVNSNGSVVVRKPGDYITKMIETAGGCYALDDITDEEDNALSTMNMQMEAFYDKAVDADILIYNSAIESDLDSVADLTALAGQFEDFKAVRNGDVWCTNKNVFQKTTGAADMIIEMNRIFCGAEDDSGMEYFHKLR
jgi:iron complex transport system substrate-binding protein